MTCPRLVSQKVVEVGLKSSVASLQSSTLERHQVLPPEATSYPPSPLSWRGVRGSSRSGELLQLEPKITEIRYFPACPQDWRMGKLDIYFLWGERKLISMIIDLWGILKNTSLSSQNVHTNSQGSDIHRSPFRPRKGPQTQFKNVISKRKRQAWHINQILSRAWCLLLAFVCCPSAIQSSFMVVTVEGRCGGKMKPL